MLGVSPHGHHQVIVDQAQPQLVGIFLSGKGIDPKISKNPEENIEQNGF
jgi:hypothetical protein